MSPSDSDKAKKILRSVASYEMLYVLCINSRVVNELAHTSSGGTWVLGIAAAPVLLLQMLRSRHTIRVSAGTVLLYLVWVSYTCAAALWSQDSGYGNQKLLIFSTLSQLLVLIGVFLASEREILQRFLVAHLVFCTFFGILILIHLTQSGAGYFTVNTYLGLNYQDMSHFAASGFVAVLLLGKVGGRLPYPRTSNILVGGLFLAIVLQSGGRGGLMVVLLAVLGLLSTDKRIEFWKRIAAAGGVTAVVLIIVIFKQPIVQALAASEFLPNTILRVLSYADVAQRPGDRDWLRAMAISIWSAKPLFGAGLGSYPLLAGVGDIREYPHNIFLELLAETGLIGALLFSAVLVAALGPLVLRIREMPSVVQMVLVLTLAVFGSSLVSGDLNSNRFFFVALGMCFTVGGQLSTADEKRGLPAYG